MIRLDTKAGHGAGKPTSKSIEEYTDIFCFLIRALGIQYRQEGEFLLLLRGMFRIRMLQFISVRILIGSRLCHQTFLSPFSSFNLFLILFFYRYHTLVKMLMRYKNTDAGKQKHF
jgi:hypothetical protein